MHPVELFAVVEVGVVAGGEEAFGGGDFEAEGVVVGGFDVTFGGQDTAQLGVFVDEVSAIIRLTKRLNGLRVFNGIGPKGNLNPRQRKSMLHRTFHSPGIVSITTFVPVTELYRSGQR